MSSKHLERKSHNLIKDEAWWYEEPRGIAVIVEHRNKEGDYQQTKEYRIPWAQLRTALARKDMP